MWKYDGKRIREGQPWRDNDGVQHPGNWNRVWSAQEKQNRGLVEVIYQPLPNSKFYNATHNADGSVNKVAKDVDAVKERLINEIKTSQGSLLSQSDWYIIRSMDNNTSIPNNVKTWRDAIRINADEKETEINAATTIEELEVISIHDWPELVEEEVVVEEGSG